MSFTFGENTRKKTIFLKEKYVLVVFWYRIAISINFVCWIFGFLAVGSEHKPIFIEDYFVWPHIRLRKFNSDFKLISIRLQKISFYYGDKPHMLL